MYKITQFTAQLISLISIWTMAGVFVHDTQLDKATVTAASVSTTVSRDGGQPAFQKSDPHTHSERASIRQAVSDLQNGHPRLHPRKNHVQTSHARKRSKDFYGGSALPVMPTV